MLGTTDATDVIVIPAHLPLVVSPGALPGERKRVRNF
jgi:hypothetical protein